MTGFSGFTSSSPNHNRFATKLLNSQQFYLEVQVRIGWDVGWAAGRTIGQLARNPKPPLAPDFHCLQAFIPAGNDPAELEIDWFAEFVRVIEFLAVFQAADVVDCNGLSHLRAGAVTDPEVLIFQTGISRDFSARLRTTTRNDVQDAGEH